MLRQSFVAARMTLATLLLTGIGYPLVVTAISQAVFPRQANGSLLAREGRTVGSEWIGQGFSRPEYFHPRPSAGGYDAVASGGTNLGPTSAALRERRGALAARLGAENPDAARPVPEDLVATSASGLDPHLSVEAARWQAPRIAAARGLPLSDVEALVDRLVETRTLGLLGEPRVNVLGLNLALDEAP